MDEESYDNALNALKAQDYHAAERAFAKTLASMGDHDEHYNLVSSYLGLAQVLTDNPDGLLLCRDAAGNEVLEGGVFLNLACAEWYSQNRKRAIDAIRRGVKIDAEHPQLNQACARLDCRKRCCFNFLPRGHRLNRLFGRLRRRPSEEITVHQLLYSA